MTDTKAQKRKRRPTITYKSPFAEHIDKNTLKDLPRASYEGTIKVIDTKALLGEALKELKGIKVLGIDTETKPSFDARRQNVVSLLQIATEDTTYLFRLNKIGLDQGLVKLLADPQIVKVGLSLLDDCRALRKLVKFKSQSFVELQRLCPAYGIRDASLQKIYAIMFGKYLSKSQRMSNWENEQLSPAQQNYAALDAAVSLEIYNKLMSLPKPSPTTFAIIYEQQ